METKQSNSYVEVALGLALIIAAVSYVSNFLFRFEFSDINTFFIQDPATLFVLMFVALGFIASKNALLERFATVIVMYYFLAFTVPFVETIGKLITEGEPVGYEDAYSLGDSQRLTSNSTDVVALFWIFSVSLIVSAGLLLWKSGSFSSTAKVFPLVIAGVYGVLSVVMYISKVGVVSGVFVASEELLYKSYFSVAIGLTALAVLLIIFSFFDELIFLPTVLILFTIEILYELIIRERGGLESNSTTTTYVVILGILVLIGTQRLCHLVPGLNKFTIVDLYKKSQSKSDREIVDESDSSTS